MSIARIFKPAKSAMQSGNAKTLWHLAFSSEDKNIDSLMGWTGSKDMLANEVLLKFQTKEEAIEYAKRKGLEYIVIEPKARKIIKKSYVASFKG